MCKDSERREQKQMKTEFSDSIMPSRLLSYLEDSESWEQCKELAVGVLIIQAERPKGDYVGIAAFYVVFHDVAFWGVL